jgi:hypothetical protein
VVSAGAAFVSDGAMVAAIPAAQGGPIRSPAAGWTAAAAPVVQS